MGKQTLLVTFAAVLMGVLSVAGLRSISFASPESTAPESTYLTCDCPNPSVGPTGCINSNGNVPPGAVINLRCASANFPLSPTNVFKIPFFDGDVSTDSPLLVIQSVEGTITFLDSKGNQTNFIDLGFTPYYGAQGNPGAPPNNITYGFVSTPNLSLQIEDILENPTFTGTTQAQLNLQVFLQNNDSKTHTGATSMRAHLLTVK